MSRAWDFNEAYAEHEAVSAEHRKSEDAIRTAWREYADAERSYRKALSRRIVELRGQGIAVTACSDIARGEDEIADLKYARDCAEGGKEAADVARFSFGADRKEIATFLEWSMRRELAEAYSPPAGPANPTTYGRRQMA